MEALRWLSDARAALLHIEADGRLLTASIASGRDLAALHRVQAFAASSDAGVEIARAVLTAKVAGQRSVLNGLPNTRIAVGLVECALTEIAQATTLQALVFAESQAAKAYWDAWFPLPIPFSAREATRAPEHWRTCGRRSSLLSRGPQ
jgi:CRISPR/Cas system-associated endonuclease Cas1